MKMWANLGKLRGILSAIGIFVTLTTAETSSDESKITTTGELELGKVLEGNACIKLQHEVQKSIILHKWNLENIKFQQRLKKFPKYIVTIQSVEPIHEPLVELRCPTGSVPNTSSNEPQNLEFYFHETRFQAGSVRLFDIQSIFPIHTGIMSVKLKLDPLVVTLDNVIGMVGQVPGINDVFYAVSLAGSDYAKEHREDSGDTDDDDEGLVEVEREIEGIFTNRIKPDIQKQLKILVTATVRKFIAQNVFGL